MSTIIHLERFVGRPVRDAAGKTIGRLHEARARREGEELVIVDYVVGGIGLLERFSLTGVAYEVLRLFRFAQHRGYVVPWDRMDFSDPEGARCTCVAQALESFGASAAPR